MKGFAGITVFALNEVTDEEMAERERERDNEALKLGLSLKKPLEDRRYATTSAGQDKKV